MFFEIKEKRGKVIGVTKVTVCYPPKISVKHILLTSFGEPGAGVPGARKLEARPFKEEQEPEPVKKL